MTAEAHWAQGRPEKTRQLLKRAASIEPENRFVLILTAQLEIEAGDPATAVLALRKQLQRDPHDFESRYRLAMCYRKLDQPARYRKEIARVESSRTLRRQLTELSDVAVRRPGDAQVREQLAALCLKLGKPKLAEVYRRAAEACRAMSPPKSGQSPCGG